MACNSFPYFIVVKKIVRFCSCLFLLQPKVAHFFCTGSVGTVLSKYSPYILPTCIHVTPR